MWVLTRVSTVDEKELIATSPSVEFLKMLANARIFAWLESQGIAVSEVQAKWESVPIHDGAEYYRPRPITNAGSIKATFTWGDRYYIEPVDWVTTP